MATTISKTKYTSSDRTNGFACFVEIQFHQHQEAYGWNIWDCVDDNPGRIAKHGHLCCDEFFEDQDSCIRSANAEAERYLQQLAIDDPNQIKRWWGDRPSSDVVISRETLEAMPGEWQQQFLELMQELEYEPSTEDIQPKYFKLSGGEIMRFVRQEAGVHRYVSLSRPHQDWRFRERIPDDRLEPVGEAEVVEIVEAAKQRLAGLKNAKRYLLYSYVLLDQLTREELIIALANELADSEMFADRLTHVYDFITRSTISNPNTPPQTAIQVMEEFWSLRQDGEPED